MVTSYTYPKQWCVPNNAHGKLHEQLDKEAELTLETCLDKKKLTLTESRENKKCWV
jgi:hypothetical protein